MSVRAESSPNTAVKPQSRLHPVSQRTVRKADFTIILPIKKVLRLLVAGASATTTFAETSETPVTAAGRPEMSGSKSEAPPESLRGSSYTVSTDVYNWNGSVTTVTTTVTCGSCSDAQACAAAVAENTAFINSYFQFALGSGPVGRGYLIPLPTLAPIRTGGQAERREACLPLCLGGSTKQ